ncbi:hypothetical protein FJY70_05200, partial [candidate division WOR-3 bacterium]|nr:hypothetical protein [candidate division WOR-3 bacterium]
MRKAAYLLLLMVAESAAVVRAYSVEPVCADWSGWTGFQNTVSEVITCNFDSLAYVELFAGAKGAGGAYTATVLEDGMPLTSSDGDRVPDHAWVRFDAWTQQVGFTKGKQYEFKFTRSGSDSIQFYFQHGDPYPWGEMKVAGEGNTDKDLCMRLSGQMKVVDETYFGMIPAAYPDAQLMGQWKDRLRESGAKRVLFDIYWPQIQPTGPGNWDFSTFDSRLAYLADTLGCEVLARVQLSPKWASARVDSVWFVDTILDTAYMRLDTSVYCAPRNLWMSTVPEDSNYWARFIDSLVKHYDNAVYGGIHDWEVFNEMNDTSLGVSGFTGWWRRPNVQYDLEGGLRGLCSLYVKLC